ncbi:2,4-dienoyl-CoA reductase [Gammaproteobacteria bacterium 42_54_T18]|nr:2,4-dienoyl-CoA reductase [Gammaproteobacteria bacterium 42_54_T18]
MAYQSTYNQCLMQDKLAVITGGGSGIGRCVAHELASLGARVIITGRSADKLETVAKEILEDGGDCDWVAFDIRDEDSVTKAIEGIVKKHQKIVFLVNNAGGQFQAPIEEISKNGFQAVVNNNLVGGFLVSREVFKQSMKKHGGSVVNITADNLNGMPLMAHSGAARAGMENLTKSQAWEWGQYGVRVNAVAPGWIVSSGFDTYDQEMTDILLKLKDHVPLKRYGSEAEISAAVCFLLGPSGNFISGQCLRVDGGSSMGSAPAIWPLPPGDATNSETFNGFHRAVDPEILKNNDS